MVLEAATTSIYPGKAALSSLSAQLSVCWRNGGFAASRVSGSRQLFQITGSKHPHHSSQMVHLLLLLLIVCPCDKSFLPSSFLMCQALSVSTWRTDWIIKYSSKVQRNNLGAWGELMLRASLITTLGICEVLWRYHAGLVFSQQYKWKKSCRMNSQGLICNRGKHEVGLEQGSSVAAAPQPLEPGISSSQPSPEIKFHFGELEQDNPVPFLWEFRKCLCGFISGVKCPWRDSWGQELDLIPMSPLQLRTSWF